MQTDILIQSFLDGVYDERLLDVYADETKIYYQRERYINAIKKFEQCYKPGDVELFSAPGRSEIGGNHTDHQTSIHNSRFFGRSCIRCKTGYLCRAGTRTQPRDPHPSRRVRIPLPKSPNCCFRAGWWKLQEPSLPSF